MLNETIKDLKTSGNKELITVQSSPVHAWAILVAQSSLL